MRLAVTLIFLVAAGSAPSETVRHEPIHDGGRVFTANDFREYLKTLRVQQAVEKLSRSQLSADQRKRLADFAERLLEQNQQPGEKKDLKIPEELLKNPAIKKLLEDEKFIDQLLKNKSLMDLAERIARNYNFPNSPMDSADNPFGPGRSASGGQRDGGGRSEMAGTGQGPGGRRQGRGTVGGAQSGGRGANGGFNRGGGSGPGGAAAGGSGGQAVRTGGAQTDGEPGHRLLRQLTDSAQKAGVLKRSRALDQFEQKLEADAGDREYVGPRADGPDVPDWLDSTSLPELPNAQTVDQWMDRVGKISLEDIKLPPGLADWAPTLASVPMPRLPNIGGSFATPPIPRIPSFALSQPTVRGSGAFAGLLTVAAALAVAGVLLRSRLEPLMRARRAGSLEQATAIRPGAPLDITDRSSIRAWFEYLALVCLGEPARSRNHIAIAESLREKTSSEAESAAGLADLYEQARYLPPGEEIGGRG